MGNSLDDERVLSKNSTGRAESQLYIVSTPIGNLGDMTPRAVQVLQQVDLIAAEDTRHSAKLLNHFDISTPCWAVHDHNEQQQASKIVDKLRQGQSVALISDAGTPLISDPGYKLLSSCVDAGIEVVSIPGACAVVAALSVAGLASDRFGFYGFLPAKSKGRKDALVALNNVQHTLIFYESPHRILASLEDFNGVFGPERQGVLVRELTKQYETVLRGTFAELLQRLNEDSNQSRGEMVVLVEGAAPSEQVLELSEPMQWLARELNQELATKRAAELVARVSGVGKKDIYRWLISEQG